MTSASDQTQPVNLPNPQTIEAATTPTSIPPDSSVSQSTSNPQSVPLSEVLKAADQSLATTPQTTAVAATLNGTAPYSVEADNFKCETAARVDSLNYKVGMIQSQLSDLEAEFATRSAALISEHTTRQNYLQSQLDDASKALTTAQQVVDTLSTK